MLLEFSYGYFIVHVYTGSKESLVLQNDEVTLYPNPATSSFKINCDAPEALIDKFLVTVSDITGETMIKTSSDRDQDIEVSNLPSGIYLITLSNETHSFSIAKKLIVAR